MFLQRKGDHCLIALLTIAGIGVPSSIRADPTHGQIIMWGRVVDPHPANELQNWVPPGRFKAVATGHTFTLFLKSSTDPLEDGKIVARSASDYFLLRTTAPTAAGHKAIAAGFVHALAIDKNDKVVAWGSAVNEALQPGRVPPALANVTATAIAAGEDLSAFIVKDNAPAIGALAGDMAFGCDAHLLFQLRSQHRPPYT